LNTGLNREDAKGAIIQRDNDDPELDAVLSSAHHLQLHLIKETNRHSEAMRKTELGFFGRIIGGEATAPFVVATFVVFLGFLAAASSWFMAAWEPNQAEFWAKQAERGISVASAAVAFIFVRGSK
jgi:hypothetical protein